MLNSIRLVKPILLLVGLSCLNSCNKGDSTSAPTTPPDVRSYWAGTYYGFGNYVNRSNGTASANNVPISLSVGYNYDHTQLIIQRQGVTSISDPLYIYFAFYQLNISDANYYSDGSVTLSRSSNRIIGSASRYSAPANGPKIDDGITFDVSK